MIKRETLKSIVATNAVAKPIINRFGIGGITLVYHNCGKRIEFSNNVLNMFGNPEYVEVNYSDEYLLLTSAEKGFALKAMGKRQVIYCAPLVKEILEHYKLDYKNQTCFTFTDIDIVEGEEKTIAVKIK